MDETLIQQKFDALPAAFKEIEDEVKEIEAQEQGLTKRKAQCQIKMFRLQGEHRVLKSLLDSKE
jgi:hypothetical protein